MDFDAVQRLLPAAFSASPTPTLTRPPPPLCPTGFSRYFSHRLNANNWTDFGQLVNLCTAGWAWREINRKVVEGRVAEGEMERKRMRGRIKVRGRRQIQQLQICPVGISFSDLSRSSPVGRRVHQSVRSSFICPTSGNTQKRCDLGHAFLGPQRTRRWLYFVHLASRMITPRRMREILHPRLMFVVPCPAPLILPFFSSSSFVSLAAVVVFVVVE